MSYIIKTLQKIEARQKPAHEPLEDWVTELTDMPPASTSSKHGYLKNVLLVLSIVCGMLVGGLVTFYMVTSKTTMAITKGTKSETMQINTPKISKQKAVISEKPMIKRKVIIPQKPSPMRLSTAQQLVAKKPPRRDLSNFYKLTAIGKLGEKKYVSIDGEDYHIDGQLNDMVITQIKKKHVYLKNIYGGQKYVIGFQKYVKTR